MLLTISNGSLYFFQNKVILYISEFDFTPIVLYLIVENGMTNKKINRLSISRVNPFLLYYRV